MTYLTNVKNITTTGSVAQCLVLECRGVGQMEQWAGVSIEFQCNENIQCCGYTLLIVTLSQILFCFILTLFSVHSICDFQTISHRVLSEIPKNWRADDGSLSYQGWRLFVTVLVDTLWCGGGLGLATLRGCVVLNVVQTIILITPPLPPPLMYQSVISVTVAI